MTVHELSYNIYKSGPEGCNFPSTDFECSKNIILVDKGPHRNKSIRYGKWA